MDWTLTVRAPLHPDGLVKQATGGRQPETHGWDGFATLHFDTGHWRFDLRMPHRQVERTVGDIHQVVRAAPNGDAEVALGSDRPLPADMGAFANQVLAEIGYEGHAPFKAGLAYGRGTCAAGLTTSAS